MSSFDLMREDEIIAQMSENEVRVRMFGTLEVENKLGCVEENLKKPSVSWLLFKYLLINPHRRISVDEVVQTLWPKNEYDEDGSVVRVRLVRLRRSLAPLKLDGTNGLVKYTSGEYWLNPRYPLVTDEDVFRSLKKRIEACGPSDPEGLALCSRALELFRGGFLQHSYDAPWLQANQELYRREFCALAQSTLGRMRALGDDSPAELLCGRAAAVVPEAEDTHRAIISYLTEQKREILLTRHIHQLSHVNRKGAAWLNNI